MKLIAIRNNNITTLLYKGKHHTFTGEKADEVYEAYVTCKKTPCQAAFEYLEEVIAPVRKFLHLGIIEEHSNGNYYLKGTKYPMPEALAKQIIDFAEKGYPFEPLVRFWKLCLLNPNKTARDGFFEYCNKFGIVITDNGYAVIYKAVNRGNTSESSELAEFVAKQYAKVKRWKKSPSNYDVMQTVEGTLFITDSPSKYDDDCIGNLSEIYDRVGELMSEEDAFVPIHRGGTHGTIIRLGEPVRMPREECDPDITQDCSYGLHVGHTTYVQHFGYDKSVLLACLVNPMNVVALPEYDNSKIRVCEYYPYAILEKEEDGTLSEITDEVYWEEDYKDYEDDVFDKLAEGDFSDDPMMEDNDVDVVYVASIV